jgi:hypothetical protein
LFNSGAVRATEDPNTARSFAGRIRRSATCCASRSMSCSMSLWNHLDRFRPCRRRTAGNRPAISRVLKRLVEQDSTPRAASASPKTHQRMSSPGPCRIISSGTGIGYDVGAGSIISISSSSSSRSVSPRVSAGDIASERRYPAMSPAVNRSTPPPYEHLFVYCKAGRSAHDDHSNSEG